MATQFSVPIEYFFRRVEEDRKFFNYFQLSDADAMALATNRATQYLYESCTRIVFECPDKATYFDYDANNNTFSGDLTQREILLLSSIMYEMYLNRDIAKLKCWNVNFTPTDLRVFDPSNARKTFLSMYNTVVAENDHLMDVYRNSDRETGEMLAINFPSYEG